MSARILVDALEVVASSDRDIEIGDGDVFSYGEMLDPVGFDETLRRAVAEDPELAMAVPA